MSAFLVVFLLFQPPAAGQSPASQEPDAPPPPSDAPYTGQGRFVLYPARVISSPLLGIGYMLGAIACAPAALVQQHRRDWNVPEEEEVQWKCALKTGMALRWPLFAAAGFPFYAVKKLFWDGPRKANEVAGPTVTKAANVVAKPIEDWWKEGEDADAPRTIKAADVAWPPQ